MSKNIADLRKDYQKQTLSEDDVDSDPIEQFNSWWKDEVSSGMDEINAMTLATASKAGIPDARTVLLKSVSEEGFVFFTNYNSQKAKELEENPNACLLFYWKDMERQVKISGTVEKVTAAESDAYFNSRPEGSKTGAWASPQSTVIESREVIEKNIEKYTTQFAGSFISRPAHWGGYLVKPSVLEFWQGRPSRLHDRIQYIKTVDGSWKIQRLAP
ncbi:MAG: pyridoxamine 5'-phosphate oxidase [Chitinophagaceae bacterium]|nr:pyridoxamine 5'-phosphate oxidase [Chitinophagaceae bacterium]